MLARRKPIAFALAYAMLASVAFLTFFAALTFQLQGTMRTVLQSEDMTKARSLASLGNDLFYQLLRAEAVEWSKLPLTFSNKPGDPLFEKLSAELQDEFSRASLGGTFTVEMSDAREIDELGVPEGGTYLALKCTAEVGSRKTQASESSRVILKMGVPFLNNLSVSRGRTLIRQSSKMKGPIFVVEDEEQPGLLEFLCHYQVADEQPETPSREIAQEFNLQGTIQARDAIQLVNVDHNGVRTNRQDIPKSSLKIGEEITIPPTDPSLPVQGNLGGVRASGALSFHPHVPLRMKVADMEELSFDLERLSTRTVVDLDEPGINNLVRDRGMLIEINDNIVSFHEVRHELHGRLYDLAMLVGEYQETANVVKPIKNLLKKSNPGNPLAFGLKECLWNDPAYPDAEIPQKLKDDFLALPGAAGLVPPETGDYIDYQKIERGVKQVRDPVSINRDSWTVIHIKAGKRETLTNEEGYLIAPPVFVRGRVRGKLMLAYEFEGDSDPSVWSLNRPPNKISVLAEDGQSASGGITLADPSILEDPASEEPRSPDMCLLMSNGAVTTTGLPRYFMRYVFRSSNNDFSQSPTNWSQVTDDTEILTPEDLELMTQAASQRPAEFQAVAASQRSEHYRLSESFNGRQTDAQYDLSEPVCIWSDTTATFTWGRIRGEAQPLAAEHQVIDGALDGAKISAIPRVMRLASQSYAVLWRTKGAHAFLSGKSVRMDSGDHTYDYRWRTLDAQMLREEMGLDVTPILIEKRGR